MTSRLQSLTEQDGAFEGLGTVERLEVSEILEVEGLGCTRELAGHWRCELLWGEDDCGKSLGVPFTLDPACDTDSSITELFSNVT